MPPELITGRDVELITVGAVSLLAAGWFGLLRQLNWIVVTLFIFLGSLSLVLAWWDIQSRVVFSSSRDE